MDGTTSKSSHTSTGEIWSMGCAVKNDSETESGFSHFCGGENTQTVIFTQRITQQYQNVCMCVTLRMN